MPRAIHASGFDPAGLVYLGIILAMIFGPILFAPRPSKSDSDPEADDGNGRGPRRRPNPPPRPCGGIPLPDADQSHVRLREPGTLAAHRDRRRGRHVHPPVRRRHRTTV